MKQRIYFYQQPFIVNCINSSKRSALALKDAAKFKAAFGNLLKSREKIVASHSYYKCKTDIINFDILFVLNFKEITSNQDL